MSGWDASMETGDEEIDRQHREIIELVDELEAVQLESHGETAALFGLLARVMDMTIIHFTAEEELMQQVAYPDGPRDVMVKQHSAFTAYARFRIVEFRKGDAVSVVPLQAFLREWLVDHEFGLDRELVAWVQARR